ncbi:hypothetical protein B9J07_27835 [Sinorhizobium sp. LM21]|uniref:hypothetical protein n=1 Tax=Sinorhizobium sp. LM21 TaxID=1449788 RepID=UPI0005D7B084|nr:hypothetical protein [Sinorhizobium sp. LM21]AJW30196.1 hypothetical protein pLM21S1_p76 [Sinorhizobium sp. LM21]OWZ90400.1 hypothetical protein B9J07_27835 [Sinorhizobium sp. LM21]
MTDIWKDAAALIEPELREFITFAPADVSYLTDLALHAEDPVAWLGAELNKLGQRKKNIREVYKTKRKQEDAKRIGNPGSWPVTRLPVKSQPWQNEDGKSMRFGHIFHYDFLAVHATDGTTTVYDTIEELVEMWSVD